MSLFFFFLRSINRNARYSSIFFELILESSEKKTASKNFFDVETNNKIISLAAEVVTKSEFSQENYPVLQVPTYLCDNASQLGTLKIFTEYFRWHFNRPVGQATSQNIRRFALGSVITNIFLLH